MQKSEVLIQLIQEISTINSNANIHTNDIKGYKPTSSIKSFTPDIEVHSENVHNLIEIQLSNDINISKWKTFSDFTKGNEQREFHIVVPQSIKNDIKDALVEHDITAQLLYF